MELWQINVVAGWQPDHREQPGAGKKQAADSMRKNRDLPRQMILPPWSR